MIVVAAVVVVGPSRSEEAWWLPLEQRRRHGTVPGRRGTGFA